MKRYQILLFFLALFAGLFLLWRYFPSEGVRVGGQVLRFPSYEAALQEREDSSKFDVDALLASVQEGWQIPSGSRDTLDYYAGFLRDNPARMYLPDGDYTFFDSLFVEMESAVDSGRTVRVLHYGDSQLEMDRISAVLREELQERFGGSGPGMVPVIQRVPTVSLSQTWSGGMTRFAIVGDSLTRRAAHHRYGPLTQFVSVYGHAVFSFRATKNRYAQERARKISKVSVLLSRNSPKFSLTLRCDTLPPQRVVLDTTRTDLMLVSWPLPHDVDRGTVSFDGSAEVYGIQLDAASGGVTVDNVALRGCAGNIFTTIAPQVMEEGLARSDVRLILLQFGGNAMPSIASDKGVSLFVKKIVAQFDYFRTVAPDAKLLFVGPADMCKSVNGKLVSWPRLRMLNDSLRVHCLENGVAYWDTFGMMGGEGSMFHWVHHKPPLAGPDHIHFTHRGAAEVGSALARSLLTYYDFFRLRRDLPEAAVQEYMDSALNAEIPQPQLDTLTIEDLE